MTHNGFLSEHPAVVAVRELDTLHFHQRNCWRMARLVFERVGPYGGIDISELRPCLEIAFIQGRMRSAIMRLALDLETEATVASAWRRYELLRDPTGW